MPSDSKTPLRKLLVITPWKERWSLGSGAGVSDDLHFIDKFAANGYQLHFVSPRSRQSPEVDNAAFVEHSYPNFFDATERWPTFVKRLLWPLLFNTVVTLKAMQVAYRIKPDAVLGHSHYSAFPGYFVREFFAIPSVVKLFGVMDLVHSDWPRAKYLSKNAEQILALKMPQDAWIILDDGTQGDAAAARHGVPQEQINFLPNGINLEWADARYDRAAVRREFDVPADARVALFLARLVSSKRANLFIRAIPQVIEQVSSAAFIVAGDGPQRAECERLAESLGVANRVRFVGVIPHERVPEILAASDLFVSTSRLTNMSIPTCEALVCGLPVVAFDVGDTREVIGDGATGRLVADGDVVALARAISELLADDPLRERASAAAKDFAKQRFTGWDDRTNSELTIIDRVIAQKKPGA